MTYEEETRRLLTERARIAYVAGMPMYLAFWPLDWSFDVSKRFVTLGVRGAVVAVLLIAFLLTFTRWGKREGSIVSLVAFVLGGLGISIIGRLLGGYETAYFAGNMLVLAFVGFFLPWSMLDTGLCCAAIAIADLGLNLPVGGRPSALYAGTAFLLSTCLVTLVASIVNQRSRRANYDLRQKLADANVELKRLDEAKMRFFANVSHELRTPLTLILGPVETLAEKYPQESEMLGVIANNAHRLLRQVNMLLDIAKVEAGGLPCQFRFGNVGAVLSQLVDAAHVQAKRQGIELVATDLDQLPDSAFDAEKIETIAMNLLSNALKFTPKGGRVSVRAWAEAQEICFSVADTGAGIPETERSRIFDRFYQINDGRADSQPLGTGLGLALVKELVDLHGGAIDVHSDDGQGTIFTVTLPKEPATPGVGISPALVNTPSLVPVAPQEEEEDYEMGLDATRAGPFSELRPGPIQLAAPEGAPDDAPKVLIVEDSSELRAFLLRSLGDVFKLRMAEDGVQGLQLARQQPPDLIISDVMMPRMNGFDMCRSLRREPVLRNIPVILLTAKGDTDALVEGLGVGADDYLAKPFEVRELRARVKALLRRVRAERILDEHETRLAAIGQATSALVVGLRTTLLGIIEQARQGKLVQQVSVSSLSSIQRAAEKATAMLHDIVEFAGGGRAPLVLRDMDLCAGIVELTREMGELFHAANIELKLGPGIEIPTLIKCDGDRLMRAIEAVLRNAQEVLFTYREDRRNISINIADDGRDIELRIADTGPGVREEIRGTLFNPFVTSGKIRGAGLGLAIARNIIHAHGGIIELMPAKLDGGAEFQIRLPKNPKSTLDIPVPPQFESTLPPKP